MSGYASQMQREYSAQSLSSRGGSDMGSRSEMETGIYMTSFAATIFVTSLVIIGLLLISLLIALTVMLQSCQSKNNGVIETWRSRDDFRYCEIHALHAELNGLPAADYIPQTCKEVGIHYVEESQYTRDLNTTILMAEIYFSSIQPLGDGLDIVLMDADDLFPLNSHYTESPLPRVDQYSCSDCIEEAIHLKHVFILKLYTKLKAAGWPLVLISRKPEKQRNLTIKNLISAGFAGWSSLIMRSEDDTHIDSREYLSRCRTEMQKQGFHIKAVLSSQMDALSGSCLGDRIFKLPNLIYYYNMERYTEGQIIHNGLQRRNKINHVS